MKRKVALAALLSTLAVTGLALSGDRGSRPSEACDPSSCPVGCGPCPTPFETACTRDAGAMSACSMAR